jgi:3-methyladenine DNA glycosylase/8-oxoguanine DNA glycosylase
LDLAGTLAPLSRGPGDPTIRLAAGRVVRASRTPDGPVSIALVQADGRLEAEAWGPGAERALAEVPAMLGLDGEPPPIPVGHPLIARLARRSPGIRIPRSGAVLESLLPAILEQKVTGAEAFRSFRGLTLRFGETAPGPHGQRGLRLQPDPEALARLPYYAFHPYGIEARRADVIRRLARDARRLESLLPGPAEEAAARLRAYPGIGPWTAAEVTLRAFGDPDAVSVGDFHLPNLVAFALAGEPRANDTRMLELLEPWRGHRARVIRLLESSGLAAPRYGPRMAARDIATI